tara:strand:+ start:789 stop:1010 length:222 start_codon:yes stop_codon:yes gene_type:complete
MRMLILLAIIIGSVYFYETYVDKEKLAQDIEAFDVEGTKQSALELKDDAVFLYKVVEQMRENKNIDDQRESEQ